MIHFKKQKLLGTFAALMVGGSILGSGLAPAQENDAQEGVEVLTRGPVHEAFAGTVSFDPEAGVIVDREPPAPIEEVPPEQELEGENVTWIPGYWAWDDDRNDFLWISGIWRNLPPGREWVPGYWAEADGKHQWTSGYWEDAEATEVSYLPEPPKSVEAGPNVEATSNDQNWIPGNWVYREDRYAWRPGYWVTARENWVWTPAYYRWTRRGYVYVDGYWDYPVVRRGVVFAPVHFEPSYYSRPNYYYTPATVIALTVFTNHLFLRPHYNHYYFGDYYEPRYRDRGFYASYSYSSSRRGYDPIYSHNRWEHRNDRNWERGRRDYFEYRRDHEDARPPRTWAALSSRSDGDRQRGDFGVADRFDRVVGNRGEGSQKFKKVDKSDRDKYVAKRQEIRKYSKEREQLESRTEKRVVEGDKKSVEVTKVKISRSPVVSKKSAKSDKDGGPPARLQTRGSEKEVSADVAKKGEKSGKAMKTDRGEPGKEKKNPDADRKDGPKSPDKKTVDPENRTKPGERRDTESTKGKAKPDEKGKRDSTPNQKAKPDEKRQVDPTPGRKAKPEEKRQVDPTPGRKVKPQADPTPERKVKKPDSQPNPERKKSVEKRESTNVQSPKVEKAPTRQVATPKPEQKTVKKVQSQPATRKVAQAPQKQQAGRVQPQKAKPSSKPDSARTEDANQKKKKKTE